MSEISIESMDKILQRLPKATYKQAKEALEKTNGNVVEAIIYLESTYDNLKDDTKKTSHEVFGKNTDEIKEQVLQLIKKSNVIRIIVEKNDKTVLNIPLTVGVVGVIVGPMLSLLSLSAAVISKSKIKISNEDEGTVIDLGEFSEDKFQVIKDMVANTAKDMKDVVDKTMSKENQDKDSLKKEEKDDVIILEPNKIDDENKSE